MKDVVPQQVGCGTEIYSHSHPHDQGEADEFIDADPGPQSLPTRTLSHRSTSMPGQSCSAKATHSCMWTSSAPTSPDQRAPIDHALPSPQGTRESVPGRASQPCTESSVKVAVRMVEWVEETGEID